MRHRRFVALVIAAAVSLLAVAAFAGGSAQGTYGSFSVYGPKGIAQSGYFGHKFSVTTTGGAPTFGTVSRRVWNPKTGAAITDWSSSSTQPIYDGGLFGLFPTWTIRSSFTKSFSVSGCSASQKVGIIARTQVRKDGTLADWGVDIVPQKGTCIYPYADPVAGSGW